MPYGLTQDEQFMQMALELGEKGRITAPPNPWVGAVIVKNGRVIGEGFHLSAGGPHAEIAAINSLKESCEGATMYVTLEPCVHYGRTPPCADALIRSKLRRVVIGVEDPDDKVRGKGITALKNAGIEVATGLLKDKVSLSLAPYIHQRKTALPFCLAKAAISIDGNTAAIDKTSKWITTDEARSDAHRLRAESQAILIGSGTALADSPSLTVRGIQSMPKEQPLRILLDSSGQVAPSPPLFDPSLAPTLVLTSSKCPKGRILEWKNAGAEVEILPICANGKGVDLKSALTLLGSRGILQLMIEGGSHILGAFFREELVNHFCVYIGPRLLGKGIPLFQDFTPPTLNQAPYLKLIEVKKMGDCVRLDYHVNGSSV